MFECRLIRGVSVFTAAQAPGSKSGQPLWLTRCVCGVTSTLRNGAANSRHSYGGEPAMHGDQTRAVDYDDPMCVRLLGTAADVLRSFGSAFGGRHLAIVGE